MFSIRIGFNIISASEMKHTYFRIHLWCIQIRITLYDDREGVSFKPLQIIVILALCLTLETI